MKTVIVTGSGSGIGRATAMRLAADGYRVTVNDILPDQAEGVAAQIRSAGGEAIAIGGDVSREDDVAAIVAACREAFGDPTHLVSNAGHVHQARFTELTPADFDRMFAVHVRGSFFCAQALIPAMKERRRGKIINVSSIWGMTGAPVAPHYCAAKAALLGLTKAWAKELAPWNIHVNAIAPGGVRSGGPTKFDNADILKAKEEKVPLKRYCQPIEISYAVAYLASHESDFVTGQVISPNGGETIVGY
jgi:3-oxoacyl-[acyl-carrier protein] reductase